MTAVLDRPPGTPPGGAPTPPPASPPAVPPVQPPGGPPAQGPPGGGPSLPERSPWSVHPSAPRAPKRLPPAKWAVPGAALTIIGAVLLGFAAHLLVVGSLVHVRGQETGYDELRATLARATTPVGQTTVEGGLVPLGTPVALLEIPSLGLREVVREGTTSAVLAQGPGHRRDTVMPGQTGTSVIMGRQTTHGGPFGELDRLAPGNRIVVTTGQGPATYAVTGLRREGSLQPPPIEAGQGRLTLVTADGPWYAPNGALRVDAELVSEAQVTPSRQFGANALPVSEQVLEGEPAALVPLVFWAQALLLAVIGVVLLTRRWGRWQAWLVGVPVIALLAIGVAGQVARLLPNVV